MNYRNYRLIIVENDPMRREILNTLIANQGHTPFMFSGVNSCLDNLYAIDPIAIIVGPIQRKLVYRLAYALTFKNADLLIFSVSQDRALEDFVETNHLNSVIIIKKKIEEIDVSQEIIAPIENRRHKGHCNASPLIVGNSGAMRRIRRLLPVLNQMPDPVLIEGESGTGKELIAKAIHGWSNNNRNPLVKIDCSSLDTFKLEEHQSIFNENLGFKRSRALDGAGCASVTTFFFHEIGMLPLDLQARLLSLTARTRSAEAQNDDALGSPVKIISSSSVNLKRLAGAGKFRKDLLYRLCSFYFWVPPIRGRCEDIPLLMDFFVDKFCVDYGKGHFEISERTKALFCRYYWPGNVLELETLVKNAIILGEEQGVLEKIFRDGQRHDMQKAANPVSILVGLPEFNPYARNSGTLALKDISRQYLIQVEKQIITKVLDQVDWHRKKATSILGISYKSLLNKIRDYQLSKVGS